MDHIDFEWSDDDLNFRRELREFIETELPEWRELPGLCSAGTPEYTEAECRVFVAKLAEQQWLTFDHACRD